MPTDGLEDQGFSITSEDVIDTALDFVPIAGGVKDIYKGIRDGDGWQVAIGSGSIALDVVTFGSASILKGAVKTGIKAGGRAIAKGAAKSSKPLLIGPAGDAGAMVTRQIPSNWILKSPKKGTGTRFVDPSNTGNHIRVMRGNPGSPFTNSQLPYTIRYINGSPVDRFGNAIRNSAGKLQNKSPDLHVPINQFRF